MMDYAERIEKIAIALTQPSRGFAEAIELAALRVVPRATRARLRGAIDPTRDGLPQVGTPSKFLQAQVFQRDGWRCRYCGWRLGPPTVTWLVRDILGDAHFPSHRNKTDADHWHPLASGFTAECEHVYPKVRGGAPLDPRNLVAACFSCARATDGSGAKGPRLPREAGLEMLPRPTDMQWGGLVEYLEPLSALPRNVADPYGSHDQWRRALARADAAPLDPSICGARESGLTAIEAAVHPIDQ